MKTSKRILYFVAFVTTAFYLTWRLVATIPWHDSWFALIFGILLWGSEVVSAITGYILIWNKQKDFELEEPEIAKERYPDVDVLIATHNEETELLYKTVNGCRHMDYPDKSKVHIYICDDGNRPEMAELAKKMRVGYFGLADNKEAKAGNLNHAIGKTTSPWIVTFDSDMIPTHNFLMETVPYIFLPRMKKKKDGSWEERTE
ncbi:glycosyltransferase, partial [Streptococcus sp.]|uniref:glycosyltransferase n=1 Tax=Streptococcus sp. TaxID=1306 RepID=UPI0025CEB387